MKARRWLRHCCLPARTFWITCRRFPRANRRSSYRAKIEMTELNTAPGAFKHQDVNPELSEGARQRRRTPDDLQHAPIRTQRQASQVAARYAGWGVSEKFIETWSHMRTRAVPMMRRRCNMCGSSGSAAFS